MSYMAKIFEDSIGARESLRKQRRKPVIDANYDTDFIVRNIQLPRNISDVPNIVGWSSPARTGSSALLFLLAGHPQIDRVYFQPQKTIMRFGQPSFTLYGDDNLVCMKEVFYSRDTSDPHDPIELLLRAGVPEEKITWIVMLRDPVQTYASWGRNGTPWTPDIFSFWQEHTISLWHKYKDSKVKIVPFVYELLQGREEEVLQKLLTKVGIDALSGLEFDQAMIDAKLVPGQATDGIFYVETIEKTIEQGRYAYLTNSYPITSEDTEAVTKLCQDRYNSFHDLAKSYMDIE